MTEESMSCCSADWNKRVVAFVCLLLCFGVTVLGVIGLVVYAVDDSDQFSLCFPSPLRQTILNSHLHLSKDQNKTSANVLVFHRVQPYLAHCHDSIPAGILALNATAAAYNMTVDFTADASFFNDSSLSQYKAVVFLLTAGHILDGDQQAAFERFIRGGGGFMGIHSATDTEYNWAFYGQLVGTYFADHPGQQNASLLVEDRAHPSTWFLPDPWYRVEEWYNYKWNPVTKNPLINVVLSVDERSYSGGTMGLSHPISWYHYYQGGRGFYTNLGHAASNYQDPLFLRHLWGGIAFAANATIMV